MNLISKYFLCLLLTSISFHSKAQELPASIEGVWTGTLYNDSTQKFIPFELAVSSHNNLMTGYTYTVFTINNKANIGVKEVTIRRKGETIVVRDKKLIDDNYKDDPAKGVYSTLELQLSQNDTARILSGKWFTNQTRNFYSVGGAVVLTQKMDVYATNIIPRLEKLGLADQLSFMRPIQMVASASKPKGPKAKKKEEEPMMTIMEPELIIVKPKKETTQKIQLPQSNNLSELVATSVVGTDASTTKLSTDSALQKAVSSKTTESAFSPTPVPPNSLPQKEVSTAVTEKNSSYNPTSSRMSPANKESKSNPSAADSELNTTQEVLKPTSKNNPGRSSANTGNQQSSASQGSLANNRNRSVEAPSKDSIPTKTVETLQAPNKQSDFSGKPVEKVTNTNSKVVTTNNNQTKNQSPAAKEQKNLATTVTHASVAPATAVEKVIAQNTHQEEKSRLTENKTVQKDTIQTIPATTIQKVLPIAVATPQSVTVPAPDLTKRKIETIQTVQLKSDSIVLSLYDNGIVDGDTVSILVNGKVLLSRIGLKEQAFNYPFYITPEMGDSLNVVMYAENLGSIPPNSGLLIIRDSGKTYEIRFSGDLQKNSAIILLRNKKDESAKQ